MTPRAAPRRCRCGVFQPCPEHTRKPWEQRSANSRELSGRQRARFREQQLAREPQCRVCGTTEDLEADHIIEIADGGSATDPANGQTLCRPHHQKKTARAAHDRRFRRRHAQGR